MNYITKPNGEIKQVVYVKRSAGRKPGYEIAAQMHGKYADKLDAKIARKNKRKQRRSKNQSNSADTSFSKVLLDK